MKASLPSRLFWSAYTYKEARKEARIPWLPLEQLLELQCQRLQEVVHHAYTHVPFYRDTMHAQGLRPADFRTADDLAQLPLIDGQMYAAEPSRFRSTAAHLGDVLCLTSSGTTGRSKVSCHDRRSLLLSLAHGHRQRRVLAHFVGQLADYRELNLMRDGSVSTQIRAYYEDHLWTPRRMDLARLTITPGECSLEEEVARINAFRPDVIVGYGSYLGALYRAIGTRGLTFHRPKVLVYGADGMPAADRAFIEQQLGIPVVSMYQSTEALRIGFQCERREGLHVSLDAVAVRIADERGHTVPPGSPGQVVMSNLTNRATVLLNYRLGDMAISTTAPCACGRTLPLLQSLEGRSDDLIRLDDGRTIHALQLLRRLREASGLDRLQVVQEAQHTFCIRAINERQQDAASLASVLSAELLRLTNASDEVRVEWVTALTPERNGKTRLVISHVPPPRTPFDSSMPPVAP